jgi:hypothetical protein
MEKIPDLSSEFSEIKDEQSQNDDEDTSEYVYIILKKMIKRLTDDIENKAPVGNSSQELSMFLNIQKKEIKKSKKIIMLVKESLVSFIVNNGIHFMEEYSDICDDFKFENYTIPQWQKVDELTQPMLPLMGAEDMLNIDKYIDNNCKWNIIRKANEAGAPIVKKKKEILRYNVGQIVGAKDQERKWWMARILYIVDDPNYPYPWYYVHFEGWGDIQNEWISSPIRLKKFNPRRDILRR